MSEEKNTRNTYEDSFKTEVLAKFTKWEPKQFKAIAAEVGVKEQTIRLWAKHDEFGGQTTMGVLTTKPRVTNDGGTGLTVADLLLMTPDQQQELQDGRDAIATIVSERDSLKLQLDKKQAELDKKVSELTAAFKNK